jgi:hypothetical protein
MDMCVYEAGQDGHPLCGDYLGLVRYRDPCSWSGENNSLTLDNNCCIPDWIFTISIDQGSPQKYDAILGWIGWSQSQG